MQNEHKNIDDLFKSNLSGLETIAPAFVKTNVDKKLFSKKKFIFFFLTLAILISVSTFLITNPFSTESDLSQNNSQNHNNTSTTNSVISQNETLTNTGQTNTTNKSTNTSNNPSNSLDITKNDLLANHTINQTTNPKNNPKTSSTAQPSTTTNTNPNLTVNLPTNTPSQINHSTIQNNPTISTGNTNVTPTLSTPSKTDKKETEPESSLPKNNINLTQSDTVNTLENSDQVVPINTTLSSTTQSDSIKDDTTNSDTENSVAQITDQDTAVTEDVVPENTTVTLDPTLKPKTTHFLFSLNTGLNFSKATYSATNANDANYYQTNNSEKINVEHNLTANVLVKNKFLIGSGIGLSQSSYTYAYNHYSNQEFTTVDTNTTFDSYIYDSSDTLQEFPLDSIYITTYDTLTHYDSISTPYNGTTTANYFHIPFQIGYVFNFNKWMVGITANVRYNILYKSNGQYYTDHTVTTFDKSNSIFRSSYFDFALKTDVYYNLFNNFYANASLKYSPKMNNTYQNLPVERHLKYIHAGLGLTYKL